MKIRITALIFSVAMLVVLLTGCACQHEWTEATCLIPKTCNLCQETEGVALGHIWGDATYDTPKTCSRCDTTEGDPILPDFEKYGLSCNVQEGYKYPFITSCATNPTEKTTGSLVVSNYQVFESDEAHFAKEGYEWRCIDCVISFTDENANNYLFSWADFWTSYYDIEGWNKNNKIIKVEENEKIINHEIIIDGQIFIITCISETEFWDDCYKIKYYTHVPIGFDGVVIGFRDPSVEWEKDMNVYDVVDENTLLLRMDEKTLKSNKLVTDIPEGTMKMVMVPKTVVANYLEATPWSITWNFEWDSEGYPIRVIWKTSGDSTYSVFIKKGSDFYVANTTKNGIDKLEDDDFRIFKSMHPYRYGAGWYTGYAERSHTMLCLQFADGTREEPTISRSYYELPDGHVHDEECLEYLYADFTYNDYGKPIRIDTYNLQEKLAGYAEIEWMEIEIQP